MIGRLARLRSRPRRASTLALLLVPLALLWIDARALTPEANTRDAALYEQIGVDLARTGVYGEAGTPTREVEPMHSALIALQVRLDPRLRDALATGEVTAGPESRALKQQNLLWAGLLLAGVAVQAPLLLSGRSSSGRSGATGAAVVAVVAVTLLLLENPDVVDVNRAELPAAAVLTWAGVVAMRLVRRPDWRRAAVLGAALGVLALTRAVFVYVAIPYLVLLAILLWAPMRRDVGTGGAAGRVGALTAAGIVGFALVAGPWAVRNTLQFGDPSFAERGGEVLLVRANKNRMDDYQLRGAFVYWTPSEGRPLLARLLRVDLADFAPDRPLVVHMRDVEDPVARAQATFRRTHVQINTLRDRLMVEQGLDRQSARWAAEAELGALVLAEMRADPLAVLRTTPAFLWRLSWPMNESATVPGPLLALVNLGGMAALLLAAAVALVRRRPLLFAAAGLPAGAVAFYVLATHALPRYARPMAPTMIVLLVVATTLLWGRLRPDRSSAAAPDGS